MICSRCGGTVGNGDALAAVRITDLDPNSPGGIVQHLLCRARGCDVAVLGGSALAHWQGTRPTSTTTEARP